MVSGSGAADLLARMTGLLDAAGIPYMLTGSFASTLFGAPRTTQDIDIVIDPTLGALEKLLHALPDTEYYVSREAAREAYGAEGMFNLVDFATGWKVDLIIRKRRAFSQEEFTRRFLACRRRVARSDDGDRRLQAALGPCRRSGPGWGAAPARLSPLVTCQWTTRLRSWERTRKT
jgi:hypothetical protein